MKAEIKERWIKRLEAGPRKAREVLRNHAGGRCCLGHLCDIYAEDHPEAGGWHKPNGPGRDICFFDRDGRNSTSTLPPGVSAWAGLSKDDQNPLAIANDKKPGYPLNLIRALPED